MKFFTSQLSFYGLILLSFFVACSEPTELPKVETGPFFQLLSPEQTGITFSNNIKETQKMNHFLWSAIYCGAGVAVGDINNDDLPDIYFSGNMVADRLYLNLGDLKFKEISGPAGIVQPEGWSTGASMVDINQDGWLDIYVCRFGKSLNPNDRRNQFYINNGDNTFKESAADYGLNSGGNSKQATFLDYDKDGDLDVYLVNQPPDNRLMKRVQETKDKTNPNFSDRLYQNDGNNKFTDVSDQVGISNFAYGLNAVASDMNGDGWVDIYVSTDYNEPDAMYINNGDGTFTNKILEAVKHISFYSMGSDIADYNNDGLSDIFAVDMAAADHFRSKTNMGSMRPATFWGMVEKGNHYQYMFNTLQLNNGNGTYSEIGQLAGISKTDWSWGVLLADMDNDGWKDVFISNGVKKDMRNNDFLNLIKSLNEQGHDQFDLMKLLERVPSTPLSNFAYRNNGNLTFSYATQAWGLTQRGFSSGMAYADLDLDGDLDFVVNNTDSPASIFENRMGRNNNYLRLKLTGKNNTPAYHAKVKLSYNNQIQVQELTSTRGFMSSVEPIVHFGLGNITQVDKVSITWADGKETVLENVRANQVLDVQEQKSKKILAEETPATATFFKDYTAQLGLKYKHQENDYDDFIKEILLPHKQSENGPYLTVGDVNGDGLEDFYTSGAAGFAGSLYLQQAGGGFQAADNSVFTRDKASEDLGCLLFDADNDKDLDLYVVSGGNSFKIGDKAFQDRLYLNDGQGNFSKSTNALPKIDASGQSVISADIDEDGDLDLFVGGRIIPGRYPSPATSYLLRNDGGRFTDITQQIAPELEKIGLVTSALFSDYDGDGDLDLMVVGEWMPVTVFQNNDGQFTNQTATAGLADATGWWWSITEGDFDKDGDIDYVVGNMGKNHKYKATPEKPFMVFGNDFDNNGTNDVVLASYSRDALLPVRGRECTSEQMPFVAEKFPTYTAFAKATIDKIYPEEALENSVKHEVKTFYSSYLRNNGDGTFTVLNLPIPAQIAPIRSLLSLDVNQDGHLDIVAAGNLYQAEVETIRHDAGIGWCLLGDGKGNFQPQTVTQSGFFAPHDARDIKTITIGGQSVVLVANNQEAIQGFELK